MNILLVYPEYPVTFWGHQYVLNFVSRKAAFPPLGLLTVSSMLPSNWEQILVDLNVGSLEDHRIKWADMVFISAMLIQDKSTREIIGRCRKLGKTIVAGGPAFNSCHEEYDNVDHFVLYEAETNLPRFLSDLEKGTLKKIYSSTEKTNISNLPIPNWKLIDFKKYVTMPIQYSRGCPFDCEFCDIIVMNGRIPRAKSNEQFLAEINSLYKYGWNKTIFVVDDNFIGNKNNVKKLLPQLISWQEKNNYPFKFLTEASINLADDEELVSLMVKANFSKVFLGLETPDVNGLMKCNKKQNLNRDINLSIKVLQRHGLQVMAGFIVGFDTDKDSIFEDQIKFIQENGIVTAMIGLLTALPQTKLWNRLKKEKRLLDKSSGNNMDGTLNFIPKMNREKIEDGYKKILTSIYSHKNYYKRIDTFIKNYNPLSKGRFSFDDLKIFFKSAFKIGIVSSARFFYWRLMIKTAIVKLQAVPIAIELAILGIHYEKVTRNIDSY